MNIPLLVRLYCGQDLSVDKLPYTQEMDAIVADYSRQQPREQETHHSIYHTLMLLRKKRLLPRRTPRVSPRSTKKEAAAVSRKQGRETATVPGHTPQ